MNKITSDEIIKLLFLPMSDDNILNTFEALNIEIPVLDKNYEKEGVIYLLDDDNSGLQFSFSESSQSSEDGMPILSGITFSKDHKVHFPFNINSNDCLDIVIKKIGKNPEFCNKMRKESKQWIFGIINGKEVSITIHFSEEFQNGINTIVVGEFNETVINRSPFMFPCNELKE